MHRSLPSRHLVRSLKCHITGTWAYPLATALSVPGTIQENHRSGVLFLFDADSEGHALKPSLELIVAFLTWVHIRGFGKDYEILRHGEIGPSGHYEIITGNIECSQSRRDRLHLDSELLRDDHGSLLSDDKSGPIRVRAYIPRRN